MQIQWLCTHKKGAGYSLCQRCSSFLGQARPDLMAAAKQARMDADDLPEPVEEEIMGEIATWLASK